MTRVYVDMVGDLFHYGHVEFLRRARELGDELVVGIHSDEDATPYKRRPVMTMDERVRVVQGCRYVDLVVPHAPIRMDARWIAEHRIDIVAHGDDFSEEAQRDFYAVPIEMGIFRVLPYTAGISTSEILDRIRRRMSMTEAP